MKVDILDLQRELEYKKFPEITSANIFSYKSVEPDPEGLASYELFGRPGTEERKTTFGWINLYEKFIHPHCYYVLRRLQRNITECIFGESDFYVWKGDLIKVKKGENAPVNVKVGSGLRFLYNQWDNIDWKPKKDQAFQTATMRKFISAIKKDELFIDKMIVIPPFFRDVDMHSNRPHVLNVLYKRLITNAASIKNVNVLYDVFNSTPAHKKIQETINEIYDNFLNIIGGTKGYIHKHMMGKTTDYSARCVISNPNFNNQTIETQEVTFDKSAVPLATVIKIAAPFIVYGVRKIVERYLKGSKYIYGIDPKGLIRRYELASNYKDVISTDHIENLIDLYYSSQEHRLDKFTFPTKEGFDAPMYLHINSKTKVGNMISDYGGRIEDFFYDGEPIEINLTALFYMAAYETVNDKVVYVTRYPVEDQHNIYPSLMNIIPCNRVAKISIGDITYPRFPITNVDDLKDLNHLFTDTLRLFPSHLPALGGDFDGDMVSLQMVFTEEANKSAKEYIYSKMNILNVSSGTMRTFLDVSSMCVFGLTYRHEQP